MVACTQHLDRVSIRHRRLRGTAKFIGRRRERRRKVQGCRSLRIAGRNHHAWLQNGPSVGGGRSQGRRRLGYGWKCCESRGRSNGRQRVVRRRVQALALGPGRRGQGLASGREKERARGRSSERRVKLGSQLRGRRVFSPPGLVWGIFPPELCGVASLRRPRTKVQGNDGAILARG